MPSAIRRTPRTPKAERAPKPREERKRDDRMDLYFRELGSLYSNELVALVRDCLMLDPLARPQSVYALQKLIRQTT